MRLRRILITSYLLNFFQHLPHFRIIACFQHRLNESDHLIPKIASMGPCPGSAAIKKSLRCQVKACPGQYALRLRPATCTAYQNGSGARKLDCPFGNPGSQSAIGYTRGSSGNPRQQPP
jgi:hypothetical protein